jgi:hypothetical protein
MKKLSCIIVVLVLACFATMVFAADAAAPVTTPAAAATAKATDALTTEAVKAATGETLVGTIKKIDTTAKTIVVKDQTITVKQKYMAKLKVGYKVKVTLVPGTMKADKVLVLEKQTVDEKVKKTEQKAVDTAVEKAAQ